MWSSHLQVFPAHAPPPHGRQGQAHCHFFRGGSHWRKCNAEGTRLEFVSRNRCTPPGTRRLLFFRFFLVFSVCQMGRAHVFPSWKNSFHNCDLNPGSQNVNSDLLYRCFLSSRAASLLVATFKCLSYRQLMIRKHAGAGVA